MIEFEFPESEWVDNDQLKEIRYKNQSFLEAKYQGDVAEFRAEVIQRMIGHDAINGSMNWLMYREKGHLDTNVLVDEREKQTLILLARLQSNRAPRIKILTNTEFWLEDSVAFMTEDVTVDDDGDSQMLIDVVILDEDGVVLPSLDPENVTQSAIFWIDGAGKLAISNIKDYTPQAIVVSNIGEQDDLCQSVSVLPFGAYSNLEDRIAALDWARRILDDTNHADLVTHGSG
jgi:hypothetical protein